MTIDFQDSMKTLIKLLPGLKYPITERCYFILNLFVLQIREFTPKEIK